MGRRRRWIAPLSGGTRPTEPMEIIELHPNPLPPPRPITREGTLAGVQAGFQSLTDDELRVARLWLRGVALHDVCDKINRSEKEVRQLWREMRRKLRAGLTRND